MSLLLALSTSIEKAFKSMIKSGRPDITDEENNDLIPKLYVDIFDNDYILRQVIDDNHTILKGRRGTGKSTIFLRAEHELSKNKNVFCVYINLQSCFEETKKKEVSQYRLYVNFLTQIINSIYDTLKGKLYNVEFEDLFAKIKDGVYIDPCFEKSINIIKENSKEERSMVGGGIGLSSISLKGEASISEKQTERMSHDSLEMRVFSIHEIFDSLKKILIRSKIKKIYLFLDDFSELKFESQRVLVDSLIAPIINSHNDLFLVKIAAYPSRIHLGSIDLTKLPSYSLDFYNVYESLSSTVTEAEDSAVNYIERTLSKRINVYCNNQLSLEDIFDIGDKGSLKDYLRVLFYCTSAIPRALGFILTYCFLPSINNGKKITFDNIDMAASKYYEENQLADFINDARFKQSFHDDKDLLNQIAQNNLLNKLVDRLFTIKREIVDSYSKSTKIPEVFVETLEQNRKGTIFWFPTSHFSVNKDMESLLNTLELYFMVNKISEGSSREPGKRLCIFSLNYGLCLNKKIDYGKPSFRRTYDYYRQNIFDFTQFIPSILSSIESICCSQCKEEYNEMQYSVYNQYKRCLKCGALNTVIKVNQFELKLKRKIEEWGQQSLPDTYVDILRLLYNNRTNKLSAYEIGTQIDKHHITITKAAGRLKEDGYVEYEEKDKRYYWITDLAVAKFFSDKIDTELN